MLEDAVLPGERGIQNALLAACGAVGLSVTVAGRESEWARMLMGLPSAKQVCIVLVDGMGIEQLRERSGHIPQLRALGLDSAITTIAPSTTAAALTAFATGQLPGATAMLGYSLLASTAGKQRRLFDLISFKNAPQPAEKWQCQPTIFELMGEREAQRTLLVEDLRYKNSGLTNAAWRGAPARFAKRLSARVDVALDELATGRSLVYLYWGNLDHLGHKYGLDSERWVAELEHVDSEIGRLVSQAPRGTLVVVTADHGMVQDSRKFDIAFNSELDRGVTGVAGEERAFQIYTPDPEAVAARWCAELGDLAWVCTAHELERTGVFGPLSDQARDAMGDVIAFARSDVGFVDSRVLADAALAMRGVHGSLTRAEMNVPWIVALT